MRMDIMKERKPMIIVFAGPNGSGKSSVTSLAEISGEYINADDLKYRSEEFLPVCRYCRLQRWGRGSSTLPHMQIFLENCLQ